MTRSRTGDLLDMRALAALTQPEQLHRPTDPATLRREAENLIALGLSIPDAAQALDLLPGAVAQLLDDDVLDDNPIANH